MAEVTTHSTARPLGGPRAAALRAQAADLHRAAHALEMLAAEMEAAEVAAGPRLTGFASAAADFIAANPGRTGQQIADAVGCDHGTFRKHLVPKLKAAGFRCKTGGGYYPPRPCSATPSAL